MSQFRYLPPCYLSKANGTASLCLCIERKLEQFTWIFFIPIFVVVLLTCVSLLLPFDEATDSRST